MNIRYFIGFVLLCEHVEQRWVKSTVGGGSSVSLAECPAELVGQGPEARLLGTGLTLGVLADLGGFLCGADSFDAQPDAAPRRFDLEHDDVDLTADGQRLLDVLLGPDASLAQRNESCHAGREEHE